MTARLLVLAAVTAVTTPAAAQSAVILVRHAEKVDNSQDAALSERGHARAQHLAALLRSAGVKAIYTTQYQRTQKTAEPLARELGITPSVVSSNETSTLVQRIKSERAGDVVLVVGHSNSVPDVIRLLGYSEPVEIPDPEYDNLFILVPNAPGATLVRLRY